jgi:hypothetical protein
MLIELQRLLARALSSDAPMDVLRDGAASLPSEARELLARADGEGVALTGLLVRKLRFERLCAGDRAAAEWFERDPASFVEAFRRYSKEVPAGAYFPEEEAAAFRKWRDGIART